MFPLSERMRTTPLLPRPSGPSGEFLDEIAATGAVLAGRRTDVLPSRIELEIVRVIDTPEATHIRYRVRR